eukprot:1157733-Pelagomonas_calceolata.AAC.1
MAELQGTSLYAAARALKRKLAAHWAEVQPVLEAVAVQACLVDDVSPGNGQEQPDWRRLETFK